MRNLKEINRLIDSEYEKQERRVLKAMLCFSIATVILLPTILILI